MKSLTSLEQMEGGYDQGGKGGDNYGRGKRNLSFLKKEASKKIIFVRAGKGRSKRGKVTEKHALLDRGGESRMISRKGCRYLSEKEENADSEVEGNLLDCPADYLEETGSKY